jgi:hypothetical protein
MRIMAVGESNIGVEVVALVMDVLIVVSTCGISEGKITGMRYLGIRVWIVLRVVAYMVQNSGFDSVESRSLVAQEVVAVGRRYG